MNHAKHTVQLAQVEPTTLCNFRCGFCVGRQMDQTHLALDKFHAFLDAFPELQHLELQGEGEPLIHPDFFEMLALAQARGIQTSVITNGSLFSASVIERILDSGLQSLRVSTETHDATRFAQIRGGVFDRVHAGIQRLMAQRRARGQTWPSVGLSVTVLASTLDDLPGVFGWYEALGLDGGIAVQLLNRMPGYANTYPAEIAAELVDRARHESRYLAHMAHETVQRVQSQAPSPHRHFYDLLFEPSASERANGRLAQCPWLARGLYMDRHGNLAPCCMVKDEAGSFGKLGQTPVDEVLRLREAMAASLAQGQIPAPCQGCTVASTVVAASASRTPDGSEPASPARSASS